MYVTNAYRMDELVALDFADSVGMGQFITHNDEDGMEATLLPFVLRRHDDGRVTLDAHYARVNSQWRNDEVLIVIQGPTAYVSGLDLPPEPDDARVPRVPSVDYVTVHLKGKMTHHQGDEEFTLKHLHDLVEKFDDEWRVDTHSDPRLVRDILPAIVAVEVEVTEVLGKWKLHQGLEPEEIQHLADSLHRRDDQEAVAVADLAEKVAIPWAKDRNVRKAKAAMMPVPKPSSPRPPHVYKYERRALARGEG